MKIKQEISAEILNAATAVLSPYILDLTATVLLQALESYNADKEAIPAKHSQCPEKPFTREAAAEMLGLSLSSIDRYMAQGKLKRIRYSSHEVRIKPESVYALMERGIE